MKPPQPLEAVEEPNSTANHPQGFHHLLKRIENTSESSNEAE